jgi:hypothetical protein
VLNSAVFSPLDLSPDLWLDAADTATITESSGAVSQWNDKSGNGRNFTQSTGAAQPTTGTRTQNGLNVLDFDGSADFMVGGDILDLLSGGVTVVGVVKADTVSAVDGIWGKTRAANQIGRYALLIENQIFFALYQESSARHITNNPGSTLRTETYVWGQRIARTLTHTLWRNGSIVSTNSTLSGTSSYDTTNVWMIGAYPSDTGTTPPTANSCFDGFFAEMIVFMRALSDNEMGQMNEYLRSKWAVY